ncbi:hypothetical protein QR685DRAFT_442391, partial [Neurospora intermedia]
YFVMLYSKVIAPLIELLKGNKRRPFGFIKEVEEVFIKFKKLFYEVFILHYFDPVV